MHAPHFLSWLTISTLLSTPALGQVSPPSDAPAAPAAPAPASTAPPTDPAENPEATPAEPSEPAPPQEPVAAAPSAVAEAPASEDPNACLPECRSGHVCVKGQCVSACNPPCPDGLSCTAELTCVAAPPAASAVEPTDVAPVTPQMQKRIDARRGVRMEAAFYLGGAGTLGGNDLDVPFDGRAIFGGGIAGSLAVRHHLSDRFGLQGRLTVGHYWLNGSYDEGTSNDAGGMTNVIVDFTPIFGPFGRFYVGPTVFVGGLFFNEDEVSLPNGFNEINTRLNNTAVIGVGYELGFHFGEEEEISLNLRSHFGGMTKPPVPHADFDMYVSMLLGVGYAF